jgi:hypothetical protein
LTAAVGTWTAISKAASQLIVRFSHQQLVVCRINDSNERGSALFAVDTVLLESATVDKGSPIENYLQGVTSWTFEAIGMAHPPVSISVHRVHFRGTEICKVGRSLSFPFVRFTGCVSHKVDTKFHTPWLCIARALVVRGPLRIPVCRNIARSNGNGFLNPPT